MGNSDFPGRDSVSPLGIETLLGAFIRRQPVRAGVQWLGERNPTQEIVGKEIGELGCEVRRSVGGVRKEDGPSENGDRPGQEGLRVALGIWGVSGEGGAAQGWSREPRRVCLRSGPNSAIASLGGCTR